MFCFAFFFCHNVACAIFVCPFGALQIFFLQILPLPPPPPPPTGLSLILKECRLQVRQQKPLDILYILLSANLWQAKELLPRQPIYHQAVTIAIIKWSVLSNSPPLLSKVSFFISYTFNIKTNPLVCIRLKLLFNSILLKINFTLSYCFRKTQQLSL